MTVYLIIGDDGNNYDAVPAVLDVCATREVAEHRIAVAREYEATMPPIAHTRKVAQWHKDHPLRDGEHAYNLTIHEFEVRNAP